MTRKIKGWADAHGATFYPVHPTHETVLGERCYPTVFDVPGDLDLAVILTGKAVDTFEEVLQRKAAFAVIFAAGFAEAGKDGAKLQARLDDLVRDGEVRLLGPNTNLNAFEDFRADLTGSDAVTSAVFRQFGITRADGLDDLLDTAAAFARTRPAGARAGAGVGIYAISGGTGAHMADMVSAAGLRIPSLTKETQRALHDGLIPEYLRVSNPVDSGGPPVADARGRRILDLIVADPNVDVLVVPITGAVEMFSEPFTRDLVEVAKTTDKPVFVIWGAPPGTDDTFYFRLLDGGLPVFRTFANCVKAVRAYADYWEFAARYRSPFADAPTEPSPAAAKARRVLADAAPGEALSEYASKQLLKAYGVRPSRDVLCDSATRAVQAAKPIGYPVVMKVSSPDLQRKSDLGIVRVGVGSAREVRTVYDELLRKARRAGGKRARRDGVLVCETVTGGVETVVRVSQDPLFGPVVMVGLGGVFVEVLRDVTFRVPPFGADEAGRMVRELQAYPLLEGARGQKPADADALVDVIMNVQRLAMDLAGDVRELDINPLVVRPRGAVALDALVVRT